MTKFGQMYGYGGIALDAKRLRRHAKHNEELNALEYDTMVGMGLSGALVIPLLAFTLKKSFAIVRKDDDSAHHRKEGIRIEGEIGERWIFVDDFTCTYDTYWNVCDAVTDAFADLRSASTRHVGCYFYSDDRVREPIERRT